MPRPTCTVIAVLPTPPSPKTVILNSIRGAGYDRVSVTDTKPLGDIPCCLKIKGSEQPRGLLTVQGDSGRDGTELLVQETVRPLRSNLVPESRKMKR